MYTLGYSLFDGYVVSRSVVNGAWAERGCYVNNFRDALMSVDLPVVSTIDACMNYCDGANSDSRVYEYMGFSSTEEKCYCGNSGYDK